MDQIETNRIRAESDLEAFIELVHPIRVLGSVHREIIRWWNRPDAKSHQLLLLPRDHGKSAMVAYRVVWELTKNPTLKVLYLSATSNLATKQLKFIKDILTSDTYRMYWPEMVNKYEAKREKWTETEISLDHPLRAKEAIREPSIFTAGLTTTVTGLHCDIAVLDDVVIKENAYTEEGRLKVSEQYSLLSSVEGTDAREWVVGTRYHPKDLYDELMRKTVDYYDDKGNLIRSEELYEIFEKQVENVGDGSGEYLWPRQARYDGKWFGFNRDILEKKRSQYSDKVQFRAQYYNNPNDPSGGAITKDCFQYYDKRNIYRSDGHWFCNGRKLNLYAAVDVAFSTQKRSDYSAIVVIGVDYNRNYYVLDIDRFKAELPSEFFEHILKLHDKWQFRKIYMEATAAQQILVNSIKYDYIRPLGISLAVEEYKPTRNEGTKEERVEATLQPKYSNKQIWHYVGGLCQTLEEELLLDHPPHDDIKDCLATCISKAHPPSSSGTSTSSEIRTIHPRFGGII